MQSQQDTPSTSRNKLTYFRFYNSAVTEMLGRCFYIYTYVDDSPCIQADK
jgi:hypothetical protein